MSPVVSHTPRVVRRAALLWLVAVSLAGCGRAAPATGTVSGVITYQGQPLAAGTVTFRNDKKGLVAGGLLLGSDGRYELLTGGKKQIPVGDYAVVISPPEPYQLDAADRAAGKAPPPAPAPADVLRQIPKKYRSPSTSGLQFTVKPGANTFDLDMNDAAKEREAAVR